MTEVHGPGVSGTGRAMTYTDDFDPQDRAESTGVDKWDDAELPEAWPTVGFPPERPMGSGRETLTPSEEQVGESLHRRVAREVPDALAAELDKASARDGSGVDSLPHDGEGVDPEPSDEWADESFAEQLTGMLLILPGSEDEPVLEDVEADLAAEEESGEDLGSEDAAVHLAACPPPWREGDSYLEEPRGHAGDER